MKDPTWNLEHKHFFDLIKRKKTNLSHDIWIYKELKNGKTTEKPIIDMLVCSLRFHAVATANKKFKFSALIIIMKQCFK